MVGFDTTTSKPTWPPRLTWPELASFVVSVGNPILTCDDCALPNSVTALSSSTRTS